VLDRINLETIIPKQYFRGGLICSSEEAPVMGVEQRD
jgi:hypothetical protein